MIMRKFENTVFLFLAVLIMLSPALAVDAATPTTSAITLNGQQVEFDAYNINDNNYFKLRDLASAMNGTEKQFEVVWNDKNKTIVMMSNKAYTSVGGEMAKSDGKTKSATETASPIYLDGKTVTIKGYTIGGYNYFKLRDAAALFNFGVDWVSNTNTVVIDSSKGYTAPVVTPPSKPSKPSTPTTISPIPTSGSWSARAYLPSYLDWLVANAGFQKVSDVGASWNPIPCDFDYATITVGILTNPSSDDAGIMMVFKSWHLYSYLGDDDANGNPQIITVDASDIEKKMLDSVLGVKDGAKVRSLVDSTMKNGFKNSDKTYSIHGQSVRIYTREAGTLYIFIS